MDIFLRNITITDLARIYAKHEDKSPAPYLTDPTAIARARALAKKNGIWDSLNDLDPTVEIPVIKRSAYRNFRRVGDRSLPQAKSGARRSEFNRAVMALWLDHPKADLDYLQDILWAYCDDFTWVAAAHEGRLIDLTSAAIGRSLAETLYMFGDRIEEEVRDRVAAEIHRRIFQNYWNYRHLDSWKTVRMNWNHVCNSEIIRTALYLEKNPTILAHMTHTPIQHMTYAIDGFTDDGGCEEGPGYWAYGFGNFLEGAYALLNRTGGEINLMMDPKIERICRYPLAADIDSPLRSTFADASHGYLSFRTVMIINEFYDIPELYRLCNTDDDGNIRVNSIHELATYQGQKAPAGKDQKDYFLPNLGQVKIKGKPGENQLTVMALAGNNGVPHNHNDIGSFIVYRNGRILLDDPGAPVYTRKTFSSRRYEILFCRGRGHSVPVINGQEQREGAQYFGTIDVKNLNELSDKTVVIDMSNAYPDGTIGKLVRTLILDYENNSLTLEDDYLFDEEPRSIEEAFITYEDVRVIDGGASVVVGTPGNELTISCESEGVFKSEKLVEESKEGRRNGVVTRITFEPAHLAKEVKLRFSIR